MTKAASKFNIKPKNGIKYLTDKGYIPLEPKEDYHKGICKFMKTTRACSASKIGEFLGENKDFNKEVLFTYTDEFDFTDQNITFVDA